jgi:predicted nucleic acid-binding protein
MKRTVLWDSSATLAVIDADDRDHAAASKIAHQLARERRPSFITNYLEAETHALLLRKLGRSIARDWLLRARLPVLRVSPQEEDLAREIIERFSDKDFSLCDAITFAVIETRGIGAAFSFDQHFRQYGRFRLLGG